MLRVARQHVLGIAKAPRLSESIRAVHHPLRPSACNPPLPGLCTVPQKLGVARAQNGVKSGTPECHPVFRTALEGASNLQPVRLIHTSKPLYSRSSFNKMKERIQRFRNDPNASNKLMGLGAAGYSVAKVSKFGAIAKYAFPILKMTKVMPLMSMGLSTLFYSWFFGLPFAVGIVSIMFSSHAARAALLSKLGCQVNPVTMIPGFGFIGRESENTDYTKTEEYVLRNKPFERCLVALSPVAGMFLFTAAVPFGAGGVMLNSQCGYAVANTGFMMAMFSQLPLGDMTPGGQVLSHFSKRALLYGTVFNAALITVLHSPVLYLCLFLNLYRLYQRGFVLFGRQFGGSDEEPNYASGYSLTADVFSDRHKVIIASLYWMLFVLNAGGMVMVSKSLLAPQTLRRQQQAEQREREWEASRYSDAPVPSTDRIGTDTGGWNLGDWALNNLNTVEELDKESDFDREWRRQQEWAAREVNARPGELFRSEGR